MKTPTPFGLLFFAVLLVSPPFGGTAFGAEVVIGGFGFDPKNIEIAAGETVKWTNKATLAHTVTSGDNCQKDEQFGSPFLFPEKSKPEKSVFEHTFNAPGVYKYYCKTHCLGEKMTGTVTVK